MPARLLTGALALAAVGLAASANEPEGLLLLDPQGQPVVGAKVELWPPLDPSNPLAAMAPPFFRGASDEAGRVNVLPPARRGFLLLVDHPDHEPYREGLSPVHWQTGLVLLPGWAWHGRVRAEAESLPAGRACASWTVDLADWKLKRTFEHCAPIGQNGQFELRGLPPSSVVAARVEVPGFLLADVNLSSSSVPAEIQLLAGLTVAGRVVAATGARPLANARVSSPGSCPVLTDERGGFKLAVASEAALVTATAPGFRALQAKIGPEDPPSRLELRLEPGQRVRLSLTDETSRPIDQAEISVEHTDPSGRRRSWSEATLADAEGRMTVELPEAGLYRLKITTAYSAGTRTEPFELAAGQTLDLGHRVLERGASISGQLVDGATNQPLVGAEVGAEPLGLTVLAALRDQRLSRTVTDRAGRFRLAGLPAGRMALSLLHPGHASRRLAVVLARSEERQVGSLWLDRGTRARGRVRRLPAIPSGGLVVRAFEADLPLLTPAAEAITDEKGAFSLPRLSPGDYRLEVSGSEPLLVQGLTVLPGATFQEVELVPPSRPLSGQVVRSSNPVAGGQLRLLPLADPGRQRGKVSLQFQGRREAKTVLGVESPAHEAKVDGEGRFSFAAVPPGAFELRFLSTEGEVVTRRLELPDAGAEGIVLELDGATLSGQVIDGESKGGVEASVELWDERGLRLATVAADAEGWFELRDLAPGPVLVVASAPGFAPMRQEDSDATSLAGPLTFELEKAEEGGLELSLLDATGEGVGSVLVTLVSPGQAMVRSLLASPDGTRKFDRLPPGSYVVVVDDPAHGLTVSKAIEVPSGEVARTRLTLEDGSFVSLLCEADVCDDAALEDLRLARRGDGFELTPYLGSLSPVLRFSAEGRLDLGILAPGDYEVEARSRGRRLRAGFAASGAEPTIVLLR